VRHEAATADTGGMSRLADPTLCPDCRGQVSPEAVCTVCGLTLVGPLATQLWRSMLAADDIVERLRQAAQQVAQPLAPPSHGVQPAGEQTAADQQTPAAFPAAMPGQPMPRAAGAPGGGLSGKTVPVILLGLGGLFVFVAVSLFLAVTWQVLPLVVKALMMVVFTAGVGVGAAVLSRKGLRGSAEAIWGLVAALLVLDLSAAYRSGLFGLDVMSGRTMTALTGLVLVALGAAVGAWATSTPILRCIAAEATVVIGLLVVTIAEVWTGPWSDGLSQSVGVPALVGVALVLRSRFREAAYGAFGLAVLTWVSLAALGAADGVDASSRTVFWNGFDGWPLLVAAAYAAAVTAVRTIPSTARTVAAGAALVPLALLALLPAEWTTLEVLLVTGVMLVLALVTGLAPRAWAAAAAALGSVGVAASAGALVLSPIGWALRFVDRHPVWSTAPGARFPIGDGPSAWTVLALVVASLAVAVAGLRFLQRTELERSVLVPVAFGAVALAVATGLAGSRLPLWVVVAGFAAAATLAVVGILRASGQVRLVGLALATESGGLALFAASRSDLVTAVLATTLALVAASVFVVSRRRTADDVMSTISASATILLSGYAAGAWTLVSDSGETIRAEVLTAVACVFLLAAAYVARQALPRIATEVSSGVVGLAAVAVASSDENTLALVLTLLGTAVALLSVLKEDRVHAGWLGSAVLTAGTLVRLGTPSAVGPEVYTLPAAGVLIGAGVYRLLRDPRVSTWRVLGSGLTLALGPSVLLALPDPTSLRALLVGVGAALALAIGMERRWQAPFLTGASVLGLLALRFLGPLALDVLANPLGAWMLFGSFGAACLTAGILWEQSLRNIRVATRYLADLR